MPALDAVVFDMDGLLVDSEPLWRRAEVEVLGALGLPLTEAMCEQTTGLRIDEVVAFWRARFGGIAGTNDAAAARIVDRVIELVGEEGRALPGARAAVERCAARGLRLAVASSSPARLIDATIAHLELSGAFEVIASAEHERWGKPHPAVYLSAAERLGVAPTRCLALEDSLRGVLAAKAAQMICVAVPEATQRGDARFCIADRVLDSLEGLDDATLDALVG